MDSKGNWELGASDTINFIRNFVYCRSSGKKLVGFIDFFNVNILKN